MSAFLNGLLQSLELFDSPMEHLEHFGELVSRAVRVLGSEQALASKIDVPVDTVHEWVGGQTKCEPHDVALIAAAAGYDPVAWFVRATLARHSKQPRGRLLQDALHRMVASDHRGHQFLWRSHRHSTW
jgi:hypothetical protein